MFEPHQRVQSGKLRPIAKKSTGTESSTASRKIYKTVPGIQESNIFEIDEVDSPYPYFTQTPTTLTSFHIDILSNIASNCGIKTTEAVNKDWRNTWNIGTWCIGKELSISINFMQPNIASTWVTVACNRHDDFHEIVDKYAKQSPEKSTSSAVPSSNGYQIKGRWSLHIVEESKSLGIIRKDSIDIGSINICQSRIFMWMIVGNSSEYLCTLTQDSIMLLAKYIPEWCLDIQEPTEAKNITIRIKNPEKVNDGSQLSITTAGWIQFNGRLDNAAKLYGALSIALKNVIKSRMLKSFLESLHYEELPVDF